MTIENLLTDICDEIKQLRLDLHTEIKQLRLDLQINEKKQQYKHMDATVITAYDVVLSSLAESNAVDFATGKTTIELAILNGYGRTITSTVLHNAIHEKKVNYEKRGSAIRYFIATPELLLQIPRKTKPMGFVKPKQQYIRSKNCASSAKHKLAELNAIDFNTGKNAIDISRLIGYGHTATSTALQDLVDEGKVKNEKRKTSIRYFLSKDTILDASQEHNVPNMNKTEQHAYNWLINIKNYKPIEIKFQYNNTPDFVTADGKGYEVKKICKGAIQFHDVQVVTLRKNPNNVILVFDDSGNLPKAIINASDLEIGKTINGVKIEYTF